VNALHLKLPWNRPFYESSTKPGLFALAGATTATVQYMQQTEWLPYSEDAVAQAVALPLAGDAVHLVLFVPKTGKSLADLEGASLMSEITTLTDAALAGTTNVTLALPRFKFTIDSTMLAKALKELGLIRAFDANAADFSGITKQYPLYISDVGHKAMIGVKETGIEAAAATAVAFADGGVVVVPVRKDVKADHPFFFGIYDKPTATWLFLGHVVDPSQGDPP
jgi:serpin B